MVSSFKIILVFVGEAFCLPFVLIELHLIRHATRDTYSFWRRLWTVGDAGPYKVNDVLSDECAKSVGGRPLVVRLIFSDISYKKCTAEARIPYKVQFKSRVF